MEAEITSQAVGLASNTDFSIITLFIRADIIVKSVIIIFDITSSNCMMNPFVTLGTSSRIFFPKSEVFLSRKKLYGCIR